MEEALPEISKHYEIFNKGGSGGYGRLKIR